MSDSSAQRQSANTRCRNNSAGRRHPEHVRGMIDIAPGASTADGDSARRWVNVRVFDRCKVDDQTVVTNSQAARVMTPATDRKEHIILSRKIHRADYVCHVCTT